MTDVAIFGQIFSLIHLDEPLFYRRTEITRVSTVPCVPVIFAELIEVEAVIEHFILAGIGKIVVDNRTVPLERVFFALDVVFFGIGTRMHIITHRKFYLRIDASSRWGRYFLLH